MSEWFVLAGAIVAFMVTWMLRIERLLSGLRQDIVWLKEFQKRVNEKETK